MSFCYNDERGKKKEKDSQPGARYVWSLHFLPMSVWVFSNRSVYFHIPKMCTVGELECLNCPSVSEFGHVCEYTLWWMGVVSRMGFCLAPWTAGRGSGHSQPWTGMSGLENNDLTCFYKSSLTVCIAHLCFNV